MEITSFILGVLAVIALAMVAITSVNYMTTKVLKKDIDNLWQRAKDEEEARSRQHFDNINYVDQLNNNTQDEMNKLYGYVDSRVDKLESKIYGDLDIKRQQSRQY